MQTGTTMCGRCGSRERNIITTSTPQSRWCRVELPYICQPNERLNGTLKADLRKENKQCLTSLGQLFKRSSLYVSYSQAPDHKISPFIWRMAVIRTFLVIYCNRTSIVSPWLQISYRLIWWSYQGNNYNKHPRYCISNYHVWSHIEPIIYQWAHTFPL